MRASRDAKDHESREAATAVASTLVPKTITITAKASAEGKLFGSIHAADVVDGRARADRDRDRPQGDRDRRRQDGRAAHGHRLVAPRRVVPDHARGRRRRVTQRSDRRTADGHEFDNFEGASGRSTGRALLVFHTLSTIRSSTGGRCCPQAINSPFPACRDWLSTGFSAQNGALMAGDENFPIEDGGGRVTPIRRPSAGAGRVPPHNLQAEESVLGALLLSRDAIGAVGEAGLKPRDFYNPAQPARVRRDSSAVLVVGSGRRGHGRRRTAQATRCSTRSAASSS